MAVKGAIASKYRNASQTCVCANRILVQDGVYDAFTKRLAETAGAMKVAVGFEPGAVIGPLIDTKAGREGRGAHRRRLTEGRQGRARRHLLRADGADRCDDRHDPSPRRRPSAPVALLYRFKSEDEAVKMANDTAFGLASYFHSRDIGRIWRVAEALEYGIVGINDGIISTEIAPFGGMKESGHRPRRIEIRHRGIPRGQLPLHGRHRPLTVSSAEHDLSNDRQVLLRPSQAPVIPIGGP